MLFIWSARASTFWRSNGFEGITEPRQFISGPQAIRGCDYSHGGLYILRCFVRWLYVNEREAAQWKVTRVRFLTLTTYALKRHNGFLLSRTLHDFCPGIVHPEVRCGRTGYQMRAMWCWRAAFVQTITQGLCRESPWTGLRLLHDLRVELRSAVRHLHREMRLRAGLPASTRWDETSAGSAGGTGDLYKCYE